MLVVLTVAAGVFGALIGSFLNVVVYRVPLHKSLVSPPSACTHCGARIAWYDNIPVLSWLILRGKCRRCGAPISARYPLIEVGTAIFFAAVTLQFGSGVATSASATATVAAILVLVAFLYLAAVSIALVAIDLERSLLPSAIVLPSYAVGGLLLLAAALLTPDIESLARAAAGAGILFALYLITAIAYPGGMGFGDVKLAGVLGLYLGWLGWTQLAVGAFSAFLIGGLFAIILVIFRHAGRKSRIPFGPWMILGTWVGIFVGGAVANWYLGLFGLT
jgi:leader peptidase (prepilin peptidase) / N-methyltransferase